ncbi:MAG TPA: hypothetical protein DCL38_06245 [Lachnospiraceae bacterium]|nr:hypothetical protein [Lachnospiraceae bacterium]
MTDTERLETNRELKAIYLFSDKLSPERNPAILKKLREAGLDRTVYGRRFSKRLQDIIDGKKEDVCVACGRNRAANLVLCADCASKITGSMTEAEAPAEKPLKAPGKGSEEISAEGPEERRTQGPGTRPQMTFSALVSIILFIMVLAEGAVIFLLAGGYLTVGRETVTEAYEPEEVLSEEDNAAIPKASEEALKEEAPVTAGASGTPQEPEADGDKGVDFRNSSFGDLRQEVEASESAEPRTDVSIADESALIYECRWQDMDCLIVYEFNDEDRLYRAGYFCDETYTNYIYYVNHFDRITKKLKEKYGEPVNKQIYTGSLYEYCEDDGEALNIGQLSRYYEFDGGNCIIKANLNNAGKLNFVIGYESKEIEGPGSEDV